jgi:outer membrane cobalamin receptor
MKIQIIILLLLNFLAFGQNQFINGIIYNYETKEPIAGAAVYYLGSKIGTTSDNNGKFSIQKLNKPLIVYAVGFITDTLYKIENNFSLGLQPNTINLKQITVTSSRFGEYNDFNAVHRKAVISEKELKKAACCNLSESFETNPTIDVSFTDAITGIKQIEFMGFTGSNIQMNKENIPYLRGLLTNLGLLYIPGPWLKSISYSKDVGSVINGFEALTGSIDFELLPSHDHDQKDLYLNIYTDSDERFEFNTSYKYELSHEFSGITFINTNIRNMKIDRNNDNFIDMPTTKNYNILQKFQIFIDNFEINTGFHFVKDRRNGGSITNYYPYTSDNQLFSIYSKIGYIYSDENSTGLQLQYTDYQTDANYLKKLYTGKMKTFYMNLINNVEIEHEILNTKFGVSAILDEYNETFKNKIYNRSENVYGAFLEFSGKLNENFNYVTGIRYDYHNHYKSFIIPKIHIRYQFNEDLVLRAGYGEGFRTVNIFNEYSQTFLSNKNIEIDKKSTYGYGLSFDRTKNYGISLTYNFIFNYNDASFIVDYFYTKFSQATVVDLHKNDEIRFSNIKNGMYSNSLQLELNFVLYPKIETKFAYRYLTTKQKINNQYEDKYLVPTNRALINMSYSSDKSYSTFNYQIDFNANYFGSKKLPTNTSNNLSDHSPDFILFNAQFTLKYKLLDFYIGCENISDYKQKNPIIDYQNPDSQNFDASIIWGPISGRMLYTGLRYYL